MKKFISMVMAAAMVVSLVPATAFAAESTLKVVKDNEWTEQVADQYKATNPKTDLKINGAQLQLKVKDVDTKFEYQDTFEIDLKFDNAEMKANGGKAATATGGVFAVSVYDQDTNETKDAADVSYSYKAEDDKITITFKEAVRTTNANGAATAWYDIDENDIVYIDIDGTSATDYLFMNTYKTGATATVKVTGDLGDTDEKVVASVVEAGISVDVDDTVDVAEEEIETLEEVTIEVDGGDDFEDVLDYKYDANGEVAQNGTYAKIVLKVNKGFEFANKDEAGERVDYNRTGNGISANSLIFADYTSEDDEITLYIPYGVLDGVEEFDLLNIKVEATDAKVGDVAKIKVSTPGVDAQEVEVANVVAEGLFISVDEDEDVPVIWAGVDKLNTGLTDDDDHFSLDITLEESVAGSYDDGDEIEFVLPEGVFVVGVTDDGTDIAGTKSIAQLLDVAYDEGDHDSMIIEKRIIDETVGGTAIETEFALELVAEASFVGPVELTMLVDGEEVSTVTIAEFKAPFSITAEQNDLKIDYRNTEVPSEIVITEAEAGLWDDKLDFTLQLDEIEFEGDPTVVVNEDDSDMEIDFDVKGGNILIVIDKESDDEAGVITISDMELYMERNLPAGAYDLELAVNAGHDFNASALYTVAKTDLRDTIDENIGNDVTLTATSTYTVADKLGLVDRADKYDPSALTVKEGFVNIVTAGREQDDASFTTKVVVPVGESYIVAGEETITLDVPAYVSEAGYTMLPVRAVATALGINNNNVLWDQATKTVTILYGQRIITMTVGAKVINVNGSAIPASASVEVVNGRTFLPMRDLATALGVTDITWDQATKTATLNGGF